MEQRVGLGPPHVLLDNGSLLISVCPTQIKADAGGETRYRSRPVRFRSTGRSALRRCAVARRATPCRRSSRTSTIRDTSAIVRRLPASDCSRCCSQTGMETMRSLIAVATVLSSLWPAGDSLAAEDDRQPSSWQPTLRLSALTKTPLPQWIAGGRSSGAACRCISTASQRTSRLIQLDGGIWKSPRRERSSVLCDAGSVRS